MARSICPRGSGFQLPHLSGSCLFVGDLTSEQIYGPMSVTSGCSSFGSEITYKQPGPGQMGDPDSSGAFPFRNFRGEDV